MWSVWQACLPISGPSHPCGGLFVLRPGGLQPQDGDDPFPGRL